MIVLICIFKLFLP